MFHKFVKALRNMHSEQKGMTGLETAIILIAFVTVASVLAYSVLSAGIFSAEKGKATVYSGLEQAQSTLQVKGQVLGYSADQVKLSTMTIKLGLVDPQEKVDSTALKLTVMTANMSQQLTSADYTITKVAGSAERGSASMIEQDEVWQLVVTMPATAGVIAYDWVTIQIVPPTGAALDITRTMPGALDTYMTLN